MLQHLAIYNKDLTAGRSHFCRQRTTTPLSSRWMSAFLDLRSSKYKYDCYKTLAGEVFIMCFLHKSYCKSLNHYYICVKFTRLYGLMTT